MFTSEEIQASIQKFLVTEVSSARTSFGLRDTVAMKDGVFDLLATVFLLDSSSFFALVQLAVNRAAGIVSAQIAAGESILDALTRVNKAASPISSTVELYNAKAALLNANVAAGRRGTGFKGGASPAVDRFRSAAESFVREELAPNIVESGAVGTTAAEARSIISTELSTFSDRHAQIDSAIAALRDAVPAVGSLRLPDHTMQQVMQRAQTTLTEMIAVMDAGDGLSISREAMLDLLAMRVAVTQAASFAAPVQQKAPQGSDATTISLASADDPAAVVGTVSGPFTYDSLSTQTLSIGVGTPASVTSVSLPAGSNAWLPGYPTASFPWVPAAPIGLTAIIDGVTTPLVLPAVAYATAADLAAALDALSAAWSVTEAGGVLRFSSLDTSDASSLEFVGSSSLEFLQYIAVQPLYSGANPVEAEDIAAAIVAAVPGVTASVDTTDYGTFRGDVLSGSPDTLVGAFDASEVPAGARVRLVADLNYRNTGVYRVALGGAGLLVFDRALVVPDDSVTVAVSSEIVRVAAIGTGPTDTIEAAPYSDGSAILGFATATEVASATGATTTGVNLQLRGVVPGDTLHTVVAPDQTITGVGSSTVYFTPGIPYQADVEFTVTSAAYEAWVLLSAAIEVLQANQYWVGFAEMARKLELRASGRGARVSDTLTRYVELLDGLLTDLKSYTSPPSAPLRSAMQMLREQGMDRARDRLVALDLDGFFTDGPDAVSYTSHLTRTLADTTRDVAPTSKHR